jgi:hypothetical protein
MKQRYTAAQVRDALQHTRGMVTLAARQLGCDPDTVQKYCQRYPTVQQAKIDARAEMLDEAELRLWNAIQRGEPWAIAFCLRTLGRERGYTEGVAVTVEIHQVAARIAVSMGLTTAEVLAEAERILAEIDHETS